ncbi:MAG: hypothetical protein ACYCO3_14165 [Mycobacteriales bacterium]
MNRSRLALLGLALVLAGCGNASYTYSGKGPTEVVSAKLGTSATPSRVTLAVGQVLTVPVIGLEEAAASPAGILQQVNAGSAVVDFRAVHAGRATITVTRAASCSPGQACSKLVLKVGSVQVTVTQ